MSTLGESHRIPMEAIRQLIAWLQDKDDVGPLTRVIEDYGLRDEVTIYRGPAPHDGDVFLRYQLGTAEAPVTGLLHVTARGKIYDGLRERRPIVSLSPRLARFWIDLMAPGEVPDLSPFEDRVLHGARALLTCLQTETVPQCHTAAAVEEVATAHRSAATTIWQQASQLYLAAEQEETIFNAIRPEEIGAIMLKATPFSTLQQSPLEEASQQYHQSRTMLAAILNTESGLRLYVDRYADHCTEETHWRPCERAHDWGRIRIDHLRCRGEHIDDVHRVTVTNDCEERHARR
ncbi:MAG: hypothetical protein HYV02_00750 [Deltaproteobacteria bacterium]|nr:hypothetical protein [Deltaproteobacteria bacterium]